MNVTCTRCRRSFDMETYYVERIGTPHVVLPWHAGTDGAECPMWGIELEVGRPDPAPAPAAQEVATPAPAPQGLGEPQATLDAQEGDPA